MKRGLFIDFDGTLVDSIPQLEGAYLAFLEEFGIEGRREEFEEFNGPSLAEIVSRLSQRHDLGAPHSKLLDRYEEILAGREHLLQLQDGAHDLLGAAISQGFIVAIVTSSFRSRVDSLVQRAGLESAISLVVGSEFSTRSKPHPDPYLFALDKTSVDPRQSLAVEDSHDGVRSAVNAGLPVVWVGPNLEAMSTPLVASVVSLREVIPFLTPSP